MRRKYGLTVDAREARALEGMLAQCTSTEIVVTDGRKATPGASRQAAGQGRADALRFGDTNRNGRITCCETREHGIAPVRRDHPAYWFMRNGDGDGVVCE